MSFLICQAQGNIVRMDRCPVRFAHFAGATLAGNVAAGGAAWVTRRLLQNDHPETQRTASVIVGLSMFWLVGGLTWVALARVPTSEPKKLL